MSINLKGYGATEAMSGSLSKENHCVTTVWGTRPTSEGEMPGQQHQAPLQNSTTMAQLNQNSSVKRPGIQKPVVERAPRSLFLFTLDNKFRKW